MTAGANGERFHSLDAVRGGALLAGILLHAIMAYMPGMRELRWPLADGSSSDAAALVYFVIHNFRMTLFFVLAGFFARMLHERLGARGLVRNRLRRIALPLLAGMLLVTPLTIVAFVWGARQLGLQGPPLMAPPAFAGPPVPWGHLWFLYMLLWLYALALCGHGAFGRLDSRGTFRAWLGRAFQAGLASRLLPVILTAPLASLLAGTTWWQPWQGVPAPVVGLIPNLPALAVFGTAFATGWLLQRERFGLRALANEWLAYLLGALIATALALAIVGIRPRFGPLALSDYEKLGYALAYVLAMWCWCFALIGLALRFLDVPHPRWRYLADASYWMYLVHLPVIWLLQAWTLSWALHWSIKLLLVLGLGGFVLVASYHYFVRSTFVGVFLNGHRYPRQASLTSAPNTSPG